MLDDDFAALLFTPMLVALDEPLIVLLELVPEFDIELPATLPNKRVERTLLKHERGFSCPLNVSRGATCK